MVVAGRITGFCSPDSSLGKRHGQHISINGSEILDVLDILSRPKPQRLLEWEHRLTGFGMLMPPVRSYDQYSRWD